jgi:Na+/proline symporter
VIEQKDQLVPYMVMQKLSEHKGLPGLFLASATSGTLSTVSSGINGVCAVLIDELKANFRAVRNNTHLWSRIIVFVAGIFVILAAYGAEALGETVLQAAMSVLGIVAGPTLGLFSLGMFCPWISTKPAKLGYFAGLGLAILFYVLDNPTDEFTKPLPGDLQILPNIFLFIFSKHFGMFKSNFTARVAT